MNCWQADISHKTDVVKEVDAVFNCLRMQLMSDWVEHIHHYGALQQCSAERHEQASKTTLKDG